METNALVSANTNESAIDQRPLHDSVTFSVENYFNHMKGEKISDLYDRVVDVVEDAILKSVMKFTRGNQSKAAKLMGLSRGTLRKKLKKFGML